MGDFIQRSNALDTISQSLFLFSWSDRKQKSAIISKYNGMIYTTNIEKAIKFAIKTHEVYQKQKWKGKNIPYVTHPLTVGLILARAGASEEVVIAGILHDTMEDSIPEKKVTQEMLSKRFGKKVAILVASVSEMDKSLSWEERKKEALAHMRTFSRDSLLVKSVDIISNASNLLEDVKREGENVFTRFNAPKEKIIKHYLEAISAILGKWGENPFRDDLYYIAGNARMLYAPEFMMAHPADMIEYADYDENMPLECSICYGKGVPNKGGCIEYYDQLLDVSCPVCDKTLLVVGYPLAKKL